MFDYTDRGVRERIEKHVVSSFAERDKIVIGLAKGRKAELGCGEAPLFKDSDKVDIFPIKGCAVADLNKEMPLKGSYGTVIGLEIIEHLYNPDLFLENCFKILENGGLLILSTPNVLYWKIRLALLFGSDRFFDTHGEHLYFFSPRSLTDLLEKHGFRDVRIIPIGKVKIKRFCGGFIAVARKP